MKSLFKIFAILVALILVVFGGLAIFIGTLNADKYRPQLVDMLTKKTGRAVKLNGPIAFSLGIKGINISIQDASIANPPWASRPNLAGMGKFQVGVGLLPLLSHQLSISELSIENADILLETNAQGQHNWDLAPTGGVKPTIAKANETVPATASPSPGESLSIHSLDIVNSQLAMRGSDGKVSSYNVGSLTLGMQGIGGAALAFVGDANGTPITIDAKTGIKDLLSKNAFPFDATLTYGALRLALQGTADPANSKADITSYQVEAGKTVIKGDLTANWGGARPQIRGTLSSDRVDPADFKAGATESPDSAAPTAMTAATPAPHAAGSLAASHIFSDAPLPVSALKAVDAELGIALNDLTVGKGSLKNLSGKLILTNGNLSVTPLRASIGNTPVDVTLKLDASQSPARLFFAMKGGNIDLDDLMELASIAPFMTGKASATVQLAGAGNSAHALASSLGGVVTVTAEKGEVLKGLITSVSSLLTTIFNPQGGDATLNCAAVRFNVKNGIMTDNGILIDSAPSTVVGKGSVDLGVETVNLVLRAKTKLVDVGGLVPAVSVKGDLAHPGYSIDTVGVVNNVLTSITGGSIGNLSSSNVPDLQSAPAGQNACVYTLDHPKAASASTSPAATLGNASQKIQNLGNSLVKGLLGR
jgi:uncharacterized protein involved in outer membrane biogenesis